MGNSINNIKFLGRKFFGVRNLNVQTYDPDAQAYFNANTAITTTADKNAINTFFLGLKSDGIYTKIKAMYLPIWGSASACKWNLVNPLDTNGAFRLTFATGMTFTSGGMTSNGTSGYANTQLIPNSHLTNDSTHITFYCRTSGNPTAATFDMGTSNGSTSYLDISTRLSGTFYTDHYNSSTNRLTTTNSNSQGFYISTRTTSTVLKAFKNGSQLGSTLTNASSGFTGLTSQIFVSALNNNGTPAFYSNKENCFVSIGSGLSDTEASNLSSRVNTLMTYFGINTY